MSEWRREPLQWHHAKKFARVIRKGDEIECLSNGMSVRRSLDWAMHQGGGECWAVLDTDCSVVGVYGWTNRGAIWSYWRELGAKDIKQLMSVTAKYVLEAVHHANAAGFERLTNFVWTGNREALAWLKASHCFEIDLDHAYKVGNKDFLAFKTKPGEELIRYV